MNADKNSSAIERWRASAVCCHQHRVLTVCARNPADGAEYLILPGGAIEPGEQPAAAARRETLEETGYDVEIDTAASVLKHYTFEWAGRIYACHTHFFIARLVDPKGAPQAVHDDPCLLGVIWLPEKQIPKAFAYHASIVEATISLLNRTYSPVKEA